MSNKKVLLDSYNRNHTYLRISLTERCNLRCGYCMPEEGIMLTPKPHLLKTEEILQLINLFVKEGVTKIRLTGGEPTVHKDLKYIIEYLNTMKQVKTIGMTTNGLTLVRQLADLKKAGLNALNVSLDTLQEDKYETITRRKGWSKVIAGIEHALQLGYNPVKVNCVVMKNINDDEVIDFVEMTKHKNIHVRFIEYMPFGGNKWHSTKMVSYDDLVKKITQRYPEFYATHISSQKTSKLYQVPGFVGYVGFISAMSDNFCGTCNRLRLLADGSLKVCLLGSAEISLRDALRNGCSEEDMLALISAAVMRKKKQHADAVTSLDQEILFSPRHYHASTIKTYVNVSAFQHFLSRACSSWSHVRDTGKATMVDVSTKIDSARTASACAEVRVGSKIAQMIVENELKKGDVLSVAKLAGIIAAKKTSELIPLCHNIFLSFVDIWLQVESDHVKIISEVRCYGKTGVEMEALVAVSVAALTVYDMCKAVRHDIVIENIKLLKKTGGKNDYVTDVG